MKYGILETTTSSYYVEGDERSKTNPGHGYPGGTEYVTSTTLKEYDTEEMLIKDLEHRQRFLRDNAKIRIIRFEELKAETNVSVTLK